MGKQNAKSGYRPLAMMRQLRSVHVPRRQVREHRTLVKYRKTLDGRINRIRNSIRSLFANRGIEIDRGKRAWCTGREVIDSYRKPIADCSMEELWRGQLDLELAQLDSLAEQLAEVDRRLEAIAKEDARIRRLQTIPGVGRKTAEVLVTALDDAARFQNARQVSAYIGLVPRQYQSGETDRGCSSPLAFPLPSIWAPPSKATSGSRFHSPRGTVRSRRWQSRCSSGRSRNSVGGVWHCPCCSGVSRRSAQWEVRQRNADDFRHTESLGDSGGWAVTS